MKKSIILAVALLALSSATSCKSSQSVTRGETVHDTVERSTTVVVRDTVIVAPSAEAVVSAPVQAFLTGEKIAFKSKDNQAAVLLTSDGERVEARCTCDTLAITAQVRDQYEKERRITMALKPVPAETEPIPWWVKVLAWFGGIVLAVSFITPLAKRFFPAQLS